MQDFPAAPYEQPLGELKAKQRFLPSFVLFTQFSGILLSIKPLPAALAPFLPFPFAPLAASLSSRFLFLFEI